jgi:hypothetical protein
MARHGLCLFSGGELWAAPRRTEKRRNSEGGKGDFFRRFFVSLFFNRNLQTWYVRMVYIYIWVCLKIEKTPKPNGFADHYPY